MHEFILASLGGAMIGLAAVLLMATNGSIMGISGIASRVLPPVSADWQWRLIFLAGVLTAPLLVYLFTGSQPSVEITDSTLVLIVGGLMVGFGTVFWQWLHFRAWCVRTVEAFSTLGLCYWRVYGLCVRYCIYN